MVGTALEAGTDSTAAAILWFIVAVILHPETLERAQKEVDKVVGADGATMPVLANMDDLPYCYALVKEVLRYVNKLLGRLIRANAVTFIKKRWFPPAPIGFHHLSDQADTYKGYIIPGKTMVIPNIYAMHRDEAEFQMPRSSSQSDI